MPDVPDPSLTQPPAEPRASVNVDDPLLDKTNAFEHTPLERTPVRFGSGGSKGPGTNAARASQTVDRTVGGYRLLRLLGEGGMGRVYEACDDSGRMVAIKLLSPELSRSPEALERFKQEGVIASAISHPHCVFVHAADEDQGTPFIAMELMTGNTLKDLVAKQGPLPASQALPLIVQCIEGLIEAHSRGMIHRDVKPANCYLDDQGNVKIGDFGLARSLVSDSELTRTGAFLGTPLYSSPEQILGETVDEQSDIYSLSATLFFLLAGKAPFESPNAPQVIAKIVSAEPPTFEELGIDVPKNIEQIVRKGLARDRSKRFKSFAEFHDELNAVLKDKDTTATLGRRFVAYLIDSILTSFFIGGAVLIAFAFGADIKDYANVVGTLWQFIYFFALEAIWGTTLGKLLLNLRIVSPNDRSKPTWKQCAIRTSVFVAALNAIEFLVAGGLLLVSWSSFVEDLIQGLSSLVGLALGTIVLVLPWNRTGKRQLLHEYCSRTETRVKAPKSISATIVLPELDWCLPTKDLSPEFARRLGRYEVSRCITTDDDTTWLVARDSTIDRTVWIQVQSLDAPPLAESRLKCSRRTRMRFLESGYEDNYRWDAYVAADGAPIAEWFHVHPPMPWQVTRLAMREMLTELNATDSPLVENALNLQCWWLSANGKMTLSEFATSHARTKTSDVASLLAELAKLAIPDRGHKPPVGDPTSKSADGIPPLRATRFLLDLKKKRTSHLGFIGSNLQRVDHGEQIATVKARMVHGALLGILLGIPAIFSIGLYLVPAVISVIVARQESQAFTNLAAVLERPDEFDAALEQIDAPKRKRFMQIQTIEKIHQAADIRFEEFRSAYTHLGLLEKAVIDQQNKIMRRDDIHSKPQPDLSLLNGSSKNDEATEERPRNFEFKPSKQDQSIVIRESKASIANWMEDFDQWEREQTRAHTWLSSQQSRRLLHMCIVPFSILIGWGGILRGGISHWFTGLAVVTRTGKRAGFFRCLWRSFLFWAPFLLLTMGIVYLDTHGTQNLWWSQQLRRALIILPVVYLVLAIRFPQRGPHDWASKTFIVPR